MSEPEFPVLCQWTDAGVFAPARRHVKQCDARFAVGAWYVVNVDETRSQDAHRSFFASIKEAWKSLPDDQIERFPSPDHLRRYALIKGGFCQRRDVVCADNNQALVLAALAKSLDSYSLATVSERAVSIWTAESQSYRAMGKDRFNQSQQSVRDFCAAILGVEPRSIPSEEAA